MSLLNLAVTMAVVSAVAAIPRRTRRAAILVSSLAILASLTAVASAGGRVEKPALSGSGPLALVVPADLAAPDYHEPGETWRAGHAAFVQTSAEGEAECLGCHTDPDVFCNQCHNYVGARLIAALQPVGTPTAGGGGEAANPPTAETPEEATGVPTVEAVEPTPSAPTFSGDVQPLLNRRCAACHGRLGGLSVASVADLLRGGLTGPAILPGDAEDSLLIQSLRGTLEGGERMPPRGKPLTEAEINLIVRWIEAGAPDN